MAQLLETLLNVVAISSGLHFAEPARPMPPPESRISASRIDAATRAPFAVRTTHRRSPKGVNPATPQLLCLAVFGCMLLAGGHASGRKSRQTVLS